MIEPFRPTDRRTFWPSFVPWWQLPPAERDIVASFRERNEAAQKQFLHAQEELTRRLRSRAGGDRGRVGRRAPRHRETLRRRLRRRADAVRSRAERNIARFDTEEADAQQERQTAHWEATTLAEAAKGGSGLQLKDIQAQLDARWQELQTIGQQAVEMLERRGHWRHYPEPQMTGTLLERYPVQRFTHAVELARNQFRDLSAQKAPWLLEGLRPTILFLLLWLLAVGPTYLWLRTPDVLWVPISAASPWRCFCR